MRPPRHQLCPVYRYWLAHPTPPKPTEKSLEFGRTLNPKRSRNDSGGTPGVFDGRGFHSPRPSQGPQGVPPDARSFCGCAEVVCVEAIEAHRSSRPTCARRIPHAIYGRVFESETPRRHFNNGVDRFLHQDPSQLCPVYRYFVPSRRRQRPSTPTRIAPQSARAPTKSLSNPHAASTSPSHPKVAKSSDNRNEQPADHPSLPINRTYFARAKMPVHRIRAMLHIHERFI